MVVNVVGVGKFYYSIIFSNRGVSRSNIYQVNEKTVTGSRSLLWGNSVLGPEDLNT